MHLFICFFVADFVHKNTNDEIIYLYDYACIPTPNLFTFGH